MPLPHPPPQSNRRMMIRQQLSFPPHPLLLKNEPLEQQDNKRIIQIIELHPHPLSLHPQFVAAKSLISDLQKFNIYSIDYVKALQMVPIYFLFFKHNLEFVLTSKAVKDKLNKSIIVYNYSEMEGHI